MLKKYAEVIINSESVALDRKFTYKVPEEMMDSITIGSKAMVPFGQGNKKIVAFVIGFTETIDFNQKLAKNIVSISSEPLFGEKELEVALFIKEKYLCRYIEALKLFTPPGTIKGSSNKVKKVISVNSSFNNSEDYEKYKDEIELIKKHNGQFTKTELNKNLNISIYKINKMIQKEILAVHDTVVTRYNDEEFKCYKKVELTVNQKRAVSQILYSNNKLFLIKGVTGSGKTEIYMNLVEDALREDKSTLFLVPEISLTPQMIERFKGRFGRNVAVFHSKLSEGERFDEWQRVKNGNVKLAIGARSAIFLPFQDLKYIIIDEEHEDTYKSEQSPKYNTRDVAEFKSRQYGCKVIYGTATPSIKTFYRSLKNEIKLIELNERVDGSAMPPISIVDMRQELKEGNRSIFSRKLYDAIKDRLERKQQSIIFLNRRGYSTFVSCRNCGYVFTCDSCDISMTYHKNGYLVCHYCGKTKEAPRICPKCGSRYVKFFGAGTEQIEQSIRKTFPSAKVLRMDVDTTRTKNSHEKIYNAFKNGEADILVGTQMISKGLDFPNVSLVGIVAADVTINLPDYTASEKGFQIITQVAGRAGRGKEKGEVILQTYEPEHSSIQFASSYDYEGFFKEEIKVRNLMGYPPFSDILEISIIGENDNIVQNASRDICKGIKEILKEYDKLEILGPSACGVRKIKDMYRWQIIIKGTTNDKINNDIKNYVYDIIKQEYNGVKVSLDVNPSNLL